MKSPLAHRLLLCGMAVVLSVGACTSTRTQKSPGEQIDDAVIATKIKSDLVGNPDTKARDIDVTVFKGRVQLNGFVDSTSERVKAAEIARGVNGVVGVDNNLKLKGPARSAGEVLDDATLSAKVKTSLIADERTKAYQIEVQTHGGVVQLAGFVDNAAARQAAEAIAREQEGVSRVDNQIAIR